MAAVADIYNHYINETTVTFETEAVTTSDREKWFEQFSENGPHRLLVAEENARLIGFLAVYAITNVQRITLR